MLNLLGRRGRAVVLGIMSCVSLSGTASAQQASAFDVKAAVRALDTDSAVRPLGAATPTVSAVQAVAGATVAMTNAIQTVSGSLMPAAKTVATEAGWLYRNGWPLYALVDRYADNGADLDEQSNCIAVAVYHEARGESVEGQLAVARVIMNRAASGKYPPSWCATVKQPWQFSFVNPRTGQFPYTNTNSDAWRRAVAITRLATSNVVPTLATDVLWYHADYVAPSWGRRLSRVDKIGAHIFYRA